MSAGLFAHLYVEILQREGIIGRLKKSFYQVQITYRGFFCLYLQCLTSLTSTKARVFSRASVIQIGLLIQKFCISLPHLLPSLFTSSLQEHVSSFAS